MIVWWVNLLPSGKVLHSLFSSLLSFDLSSNMQFKICCREEFEWCKTHCMDKICLELGSFEEFATAVLQTVGRRCLSSCVHFFESAAKTKGAAITWEKKATSTRINSGYLRWFPQDIWAIMAKITLPKKHHGMVIFWIQLRRTYRDLSSQADPRGKIEL